MCGILGVVAVRGSVPSVSDSEFERMRERLARRGPDGAGLVRWENTLLAHRRLAILDPSAAGQQPMGTPDGRFQLVYNGELYNDIELRGELLAGGGIPGGFVSDCDTETVLWAFATWGIDAFAKLRGMFALAVYDRVTHCLHLARDPLGIKPLYYHVGERELSFGSSADAILAHPGIQAQPNLPMLSAYMTSVRTVLGEHTLFEGIRALQPGEHLTFDALRGRLYNELFYGSKPVEADAWDAESASAAVRQTLEDSVRQHMRSDVPLCSLLSGGLDSSIIAHIAQGEASGLHTFCAGGTGARAEEQSEDFEYAQRMAAQLGTEHHEVRVGRESFAEEWRWMVSELGTPLSTPNEVAIHAVARELRASGCPVALSGEGADELFAGYEPVMQAAQAFLADEADSRTGGRYQLDSTSWVPLNLKGHLLLPEVTARVEEDHLLRSYYEQVFQRCQAEVGEAAEAIEPYLRFLRHVNLTGLLGRLDSSTMLASVEGRTPFADVRVTDLADRMPLALKLCAAPVAVTAGAPEAPGPAELRGKRMLRDAWREQLPGSIVERPKASFPMPFERWMVDQSAALRDSSFAASIFNPILLKEIAQNPAQYSQFAWPMINLALWGERWWG